MEMAGFRQGTGFVSIENAMKTLISVILLMTGLQAQAVVLTESELRTLESEQIRNAYSESVELQHVEYRAISDRKGRFDSMAVYTEASVKVNVNDLEIPLPWWSPYSEARDELAQLMKHFCQNWIGGKKIRKKSFNKTSVEKLPLNRFPTWKVALNMEFRCQ
jgi:hypothetical protein